jgi:hypothetical protein
MGLMYFGDAYPRDGCNSGQLLSQRSSPPALGHHSSVNLDHSEPRNRVDARTSTILQML